MKFYQANYRALGFLEFLRVSGPFSPLAAILYPLMKVGLFKLKAPIVSQPNSLRDEIVPPDQLEKALSKKLTTAFRLVEPLGFTNPIYSEARSYGEMRITGGSVVAYHETGRCGYQATYASARTVGRGKHLFFTPLENGKILLTASGKQEFNEPPYLLRAYCGSLTPEQILTVHFSRLAPFETGARLLLSQDDLINHVDKSVALYFDHFVKRGFYTALNLPE